MSLFDIIATVVTLTALFSYINFRFIRLPTTIGVMFISLVGSLLLLCLAKLGVGLQLEIQTEAWLKRIDFGDTLMHGMLSFLLFAGALFVNLDELARQKWVIASLATVGVLLSVFMVGGATFLVFGWLGLEVPFIYCLLFGALISPTDPVAVLGLLRRAGVPKTLESKITGESLFNDGVGVVVFVVLLDVARSGMVPDAFEIALLFAEEAVGGILFGVAVGYVGYRLLKDVDNYQVEVLITLALVTGGYAGADALHLSGPIAIVVAGLLIGNHGRMFAMSESTRQHLDTFWELVDEVLNAVLFVLIGLEVLLVTFNGAYLLAGGIVVPIVLTARLVSVGLPVGLFRLGREVSPNAVWIMTWGGLRGGISVALALSLPVGVERDLLLTVTYAVVAFSILVQGLTVERLFVRRAAA